MYSRVVCHTSGEEAGRITCPECGKEMAVTSFKLMSVAIEKHVLLHRTQQQPIVVRYSKLMNIRLSLARQALQHLDDA